MEKNPTNLFLILTEWLTENINDGVPLSYVIDEYISGTGMATKMIVATAAAGREQPPTDDILAAMTEDLCNMIKGYALDTEAEIGEPEE